MTLKRIEGIKFRVTAYSLVLSLQIRPFTFRFHYDLARLLLKTTCLNLNIKTTLNFNFDRGMELRLNQFPF